MNNSVLTGPEWYCGPYPTFPVCFCSGYSSCSWLPTVALWPAFESLCCVVSGRAPEPIAEECTDAAVGVTCSVVDIAEMWED